VRIRALVADERGRHDVTLSTDTTSRTLAIAPRSGGAGSSANGGELLCLALATCYCNDVYREAARRAIDVVRVEVEAHAEFGAPGEAGTRFAYRATVAARAPKDAIRALIVHTDGVAEIQNTLRRGTPVVLESYEAVSLAPSPTEDP
jgi:organic hydroperoxide reductase OsmC/OhrA